MISVKQKKSFKLIINIVLNVLHFLNNALIFHLGFFSFSKQYNEIENCELYLAYNLTSYITHFDERNASRLPKVL